MEDDKVDEKGSAMNVDHPLASEEDLDGEEHSEANGAVNLVIQRQSSVLSQSESNIQPATDQPAILPNLALLNPANGANRLSASTGSITSSPTRQPLSQIGQEIVAAQQLFNLASPERLFTTTKSPQKRTYSVMAGNSAAQSPRRVKSKRTLDFTEGGLAHSGEIKKGRCCNCKNSKCLKLYCECFANKVFCSGCNCEGCFNTENNKEMVQQAIAQAIERNPEAFKPKIEVMPMNPLSPTKHQRGCNCKKTACLKKYCECFLHGIVCGPNCKCTDCKNFEGSEEREQAMLGSGIEASPMKRKGANYQYGLEQVLEQRPPDDFTRAMADVLNLETICKACEDMFVAAKTEATNYQKEVSSQVSEKNASSVSRSQNNSVSEQSTHENGKSGNNTSMTSALMATTETLGDEDEHSISSSGQKDASSDSSAHEGRVVPYTTAMTLSPADTLYLRQERVVFTVLNNFLRSIITQIAAKEQEAIDRKAQLEQLANSAVKDEIKNNQVSDGVSVHGQDAFNSLKSNEMMVDSL
jgi:hypothetical protein